MPVGVRSMVFFRNRLRGQQIKGFHKRSVKKGYFNRKAVTLSMAAQDDVASKLAVLQADVEQLRLELDEQRRARMNLDAKVVSLSDALLQARSDATALDKKLIELRLSTERSCALLKVIEPEKLVAELSRLSEAVTNLRDGLRRHESEARLQT